MKNKLLTLFLGLVLLLAGASGPAWGETYWISGLTAADQYLFRDADKQFDGTDDYMCWAAAASNALVWAGWNTSAYSTETHIFQYYQDHWTNQSGMMGFAWNWWFNGTLPPAWEGWSQVDVAGGGNLWPQYNFFSYFHETWNTGETMAAVDNYLHNGFGTTMAVYPTSGSGGHAITIWGYDYNPLLNPSDPNYYTTIWITDSDDIMLEMIYKVFYGVDEWVSGYPLTWDAAEGRYEFFFYDESQWYIGGVQGIAEFGSPVPNPSALLLFGSGLLGLMGYLWRRLKKRLIGIVFQNAQGVEAFVTLPFLLRTLPTSLKFRMQSSKIRV